MRRVLAAGLTLLGLGGVAAYGAGGLFHRAGPLPADRDVVVPRGGSESVGRSLHAAGAIGPEWVFRVAAVVTSWEGPLRAGEFRLPAHASLAAILAVLRSDKPVSHLLTIPEGWPVSRIGLLIAGTEALSGPVDLPSEGGFLPQTYAFERGMSARSLISRGEQAMRESLDAAWKARSRDVDLRSEGELLILASLVERETHLASERALVARVFLNRLAQGMRLQSDPSVVYGETGGEEEIAGGLTRAALARATPYNTYIVVGLPAGPICSPGAASIAAAAHPARSDAVYFVADGSGGHAFSASLGEHVRNVERFRRLGR